MALERNIDTEPRWYVLKTFAGYENVAKQNLEQTVAKYNLEDRIFDIVIPMEDVLEEKRGKKVLVPKKMMPGYIIVKMIYGDDIWHASNYFIVTKRSFNFFFFYHFSSNFFSPSISFYFISFFNLIIPYRNFFSVSSSFFVFYLMIRN